MTPLNTWTTVIPHIHRLGIVDHAPTAGFARAKQIGTTYVLNLGTFEFMNALKHHQLVCWNEKTMLNQRVRLLVVYIHRPASVRQMTNSNIITTNQQRALICRKLTLILINPAACWKVAMWNMVTKMIMAIAVQVQI